MEMRKVLLTTQALTDNSTLEYNKPSLLVGETLETILRVTATVSTTGVAPVGGTGSLLEYIKNIQIKGVHLSKGAVVLFSLSARELYEYAHLITKTYTDKADAGFAVSSNYNVLFELPISHALKDVQGGLATVLAGGMDWSQLEIDITTGSIANIYATPNSATISNVQVVISQERVDIPIVINPPLHQMVRKLAVSNSVGTISPEDIHYLSKIRGYFLHTQIAGVDSDTVLSDLHVVADNSNFIFDAASWGGLKSSNKKHFKIEVLPTGFAMIDFLSSEFLPEDFKDGFNYSSLNLQGTIANAGSIYIIPIMVG